MSFRITPHRRIGIVVGLAVLCLLALTIIPPRGERAVMTVARVGSAVHLHASGLSFSFWPFAARVVVPADGDRAVLPGRVTFHLADGTSVPVTARLLLEGSGRLPFDAAAMRRLGPEDAIGEWLAEAMPPSDTEDLVTTTELWREIFDGDTTAQRNDVTGAIAGLFKTAQLVELELTPKLDPAAIRREANHELARRTRRRGRLVLFGLDGLDWRLVDELTRRGLMPNLRRLMENGAHAIHDVPPPLISPVVWTTIATGVPPEVHGVLDFLEPDPAGGPPHPVSSASCKAATLWRMLAAADRSVAVIGWWATFPAVAPAGGTVYSDRLTEQLLGLEEGSPGLADPPEAAVAARDLVVRGSDVTAAMLAPFAVVSEAELRGLRGGESDWDNPVGGLAKLVAATITVERLTQRELDRGTEVILSYLEGTDMVGHLYAPYRPPAMPEADPALARRFGPVVDRYYAHVDRWIGQVLEQLGQEDTVVVVSDHGFHWYEERPHMAAGAHEPTAVWWHRVEGAFLAYGPGIRHTPERQRIGLMDITPTLLALAGLPPAAEMTGAPPDWLWRSSEGAGTDDSRPVRYAALLPVTQQETTVLSDQARAEELAKLRALGYLAPEGQSVNAPSQPQRPVFDRAESRRLNNLGTSRSSNGDKAGAEEAFKQAIATDPNYAAAHYNLGILYRNQERMEESDREIWRAIELGVGDDEMMVVRMALDYRQRGEPDKALSVFARGREMFPDSVMIWLNSGVFLGERRRYAEAKECLEHTVELAPDNVNAYRNLAAAHLELGEKLEGRRALTRAAELAPDNDTIRRQLADIGGPLK